jgi:3-oxoacyl-[acyl-carrier-protein] synthase-3
MMMDGKEVYRFAVNAIVEYSEQAVDKAGLKMTDIDLVIPHQANTRINERSLVKDLGIPREKIFENIDRYGNMSSASPAVALCEAAEQRRLKEGDLVLLVAFGAGLSWAAAVLRWQSKN